MCQQVAADQVPEGEAAVDAAADDCNDSTSQQILALLQHSLKGAATDEGRAATTEEGGLPIKGGAQTE
jgi:hypothetical protein